MRRTFGSWRFCGVPLALMAGVALSCAKAPPQRGPAPATAPVAIEEDQPTAPAAATGPALRPPVYIRGNDETPALPRATTPTLRRIGFDLKSYPRVDGSSSTQLLADLIFAHALGLTYEDVDNLIGLQRDLQANYRLAGPPPADRRKLTGDEGMEVLMYLARRRNSTTPEAYRKLIDGQADLLLMARGPTAAEVAAAGKRGVELLVEPIALDALVFVVNPKNGIAGLSTEQIRAIYTGRIRRWSELAPVDGLGDAEVRPYVRESGSGSEELMQGVVMKDRPMVTTPDYRIPTMRGLINRVATEVDAIGYTVFYYHQFMSDRSQTRLIAIDGIAPDAASISARRYPLTTDVVMVTRKGQPADSPAGKLRAWLLSDEARAVVRESGYLVAK